MQPTLEDVRLTDQPNFILAKQCAEEVLKENFVNAPPVNVFAIVRNYGLDVAYMSFSEYEDVAGFIDLEKRQIVVNDFDGPSRQKFTVAHELGHWIMHRQLLEKHPDQGVLLRLPLGRPDPDPREKEANSFAANLLVPDMFLTPNIESGQRLKDFAGGEKLLATVFGVSADVIGYRLREVGTYSS